MKIGIIGAGAIVPEFLMAAKRIPELELAAIGATPHGLERMEQLAAEYAIPKIYTDCSRMISEVRPDCAYIAVPNDLHYYYAKMVLESGISVICEKPFCSDADKLRELIELSRKKGLWLFEAITNRYFPNTSKIKEYMPLLGNIHVVEMNFTQLSGKYAALLAGNPHPVFQAGRSGGTLMDLNVYNIHLATELFGAPEDVQYFANLTNGVDMSGTLVMRYRGFICILTAAKDSTGPCSLAIEGDLGAITSASPTNWLREFDLKTTSGRQEHAALNEMPERLYYELRAFADMVSANDRVFCDAALEHSLLVQEILDIARKQAGVAI